MNSPYFTSKSLTGKIFKSVLVFTIAILLTFAGVISGFFYFTYENEAEAELQVQAQEAAAYLNESVREENIPMLSEQFAGHIRYTWINADGTVLFDSISSDTELENHSDRPEVKEALAQGQANVIRYSKTLGTDTVYAAVKLEDGSIIRLAETRHSLLAFSISMVGPIVLSLIAAGILGFFLSRLLTKRIMKPIDALNFKQPLENKIYSEMNPLLERIDEQQVLLKQQNEELALAESMRRDFSSNVSHEMKTPLQVISGYAELMKNDMVDPTDRQRFAELIYDEAQAMRSLINDVLTLSRLDEAAVSNDDQAIDIYAAAIHTANRLTSFAKKNRVTLHVAGSSAFIKGSETLVEEMIYNLIENGIRYNHPEGTVIVMVETGSKGPMVRVRDTGPGIPNELYEKVFERFFRVDKSRSKETGGTGLGLAIVKHAVQYHKGTIAVQSDLGKGTTFTLRFPSQMNS